jgi:hypothetical protein
MEEGEAGMSLSPPQQGGTGSHSGANCVVCYLHGSGNTTFCHSFLEDLKDFVPFELSASV